MNNVNFRKDVLPLKDTLYRLALRITLDTAEAEDIVQETLIRVWEKRDQWPEIASIEAYSHTVCRNIALDRLRKPAHHTDSIEELGAEQADTAHHPDQAAIDKDQLQLVRQLVNSLPEKQRTCLQLRDFEGKAYKEIASILHITEEQVKVNIFRARQAIKQKFEQVDNYGL